MDKMLRWTMLFVVLVIFASGAVAVYTVFFKSVPNSVPMPSFREKSITEAAEEARRLGLSVKIEQAVSSLPRGTVLAQTPEPGRGIPRDKTVIFQISRGGTRRAVPDVRDLDVARAQTVVREQGFDVGDILYINDSSHTVGFVIAQSPAAPANVPVDKKIDLLVNRGSANADGKNVVPDVAQMTERQARDLLTASGFKIPAVDYVYSPNAAEGRVIGTRPAAGASARAGEGVRLKVATTKKPDGVPETVPAPQAQPASQPPASAASSIVSVVESARNSMPRQTGSAPSGAVPSGSAPGGVSGQQGPRVIQNPALPVGVAPSGAAPSGAGRAASAGTAQPSAAQPSIAQPSAVQPPAAQPSIAPPMSQPLGGKIARIRYQVPPLARPLHLKI
ncbi:MAG: PASTA domain-containing protein, partial [Synergistaceae bacterium]|nr:PASTA domain-containing protein [Synergistaceae bacterium]